MGIYDREYYRREGSSFLGSFADRGKVCKWLIVINVIFFVAQIATVRDVVVLGHGGIGLQRISPVTEALLLDTTKVWQDGQAWRLLTYAFLHDTSSQLPWHILFNMLFLWWFGTSVEDIYGPREFLAFYLVSAFVGGLAFQLAWALKLGGGLCLGASGAVTAVMVLCALHYPTRVIYIWYFLPVPIWLFVAFEVFQDFLVFSSQTRSSTAVVVHLGGAAFALLYYKMHWRLMNLWPGLRSWQRQRSRPSLRVYREEQLPQPVSVSVPPEAEADEQLEAKLDAVLEKVARTGQGSLTDSERQILLRASEIYKRRRT